MKAIEFTRKSGALGHSYALGLTVVADDDAGLIAEMRLVKEALLGWIKKRGDGGKLIQFTFVVPATMDSQVRSILDRLRTEEVDLAPVLRQRVVLVATLNADGSPRLDYELGR